MNEISVIVNQEPGKVSWNFEEVKSYLEDGLKVYQTTVYTDDTIKSAKTDVAALRKLSASIEDRRKEIKDKCLEPYTVIEAQAKELVALIEKPIEAINIQVQDYEKRRKQKVRAEILAYWQQKAADLPEEIREKAVAAIYDSRWENATATKKSWHDGIDAGIQKILSELETIRSMQSEFEEDMLTAYKTSLSLQMAIQKKNDLDAQKRRIMEIERQRKEREEAEERRRQEAAERAAKQEERPALAEPDPVPKQGPSVPNQPDPASRPAPGIPIQQEVKNPAPEPRNLPDGRQIVTIQICGKPDQIEKVRKYIHFVGAKYREV